MHIQKVLRAFIIVVIAFVTVSTVPAQASASSAQPAVSEVASYAPAPGTIVLVEGDGKGWCRSDPIVVLNGVTYNIEVGVTFPLDGSNYTTQKDRYYVYSNLNQSHSITWTDDGVDGSGEQVTWFPWIGSSYVKIFITTNGGSHLPMEVKVNNVVVVPLTVGTTNTLTEVALT